MQGAYRSCPSSPVSPVWSRPMLTQPGSARDSRGEVVGDGLAGKALTMNRHPQVVQANRLGTVVRSGRGRSRAGGGPGSSCWRRHGCPR